MPRPPQINEEQDRCVSGRCSCHAEDIRQLFICSLPPSMSLSLLDSVRSLSPSLPIFVCPSLVCPPALRSCLMTYVFFLAVRLAAVSRSTEPLASTWQPRWPVTHAAPLVPGAEGNHHGWQLSLKPWRLSLSQSSPLYSLECWKYEIGWQRHVFHCFTAIHYSLSASPPVIKWKPRRLWRLECAGKERRRRVVLGRLSGCRVPSGGRIERVVMQISALPLNDKCP